MVDIPQANKTMKRFDTAIPVGSAWTPKIRLRRGSAEAAMGQRCLAGLMLPTGAGSFEATSALIAFKVGFDDSDDLDLLRDATGSLISVAIAANNTNGRVSLEQLSELVPWGVVQIGVLAADGSTEVTQTAERAITAVTWS